MSAPVEGYVLHTYGPERYVRHAVASVLTLRRHDPDRPVALFCPPSHRVHLGEHGLDVLFQHIEELPEPHQSIVGFKHHLHRFMPFDRCLFVDADMVWCRDPNPLWHQLAPFTFTATGLERADFFFGGPKGVSVAVDFLLDRRRRTMERFGLSHLPRVQAGMIYASDVAATARVCEAAAQFLSEHDRTHFRSRLKEGRSEESCEWSLAMAMSRLRLPIFSWFQGYNSPQLDFIEGMTAYDAEFKQVTCRYYCDRFVYALRGLPNPSVRDRLIHVLSLLPGKGDYLEVTPFALHFGWLHHKEPFFEFSARTWSRLTSEAYPLVSGDGLPARPIELAAAPEPETSPTPSA
ncbi:MAG: hypothetical protein AAGI71_00225 [Bacteroidota bacterium]